MSTAQGGAASSALYVVVYLVGLGAIYEQLGGGPLERLRRPHPVVLAVWLLVAVPSLVALAWPPLYDALSRQPDLVRDGQVWRVVTSAVVQDGGGLGTAYNLVTLALTLPAAVLLWRPAGAVALLVLGAIAFDLPAVLLWPDAGGGNSGATFVLAAATVAAVAVWTRRRTSLRAAAVVGAAGVALLALGDAHGEAVLVGLLVGALAASRLPVPTLPVREPAGPADGPVVPLAARRPSR